MVQVDDKIISIKLFTDKFICHLERCLGACCVHGDAGAPLSEEEADFLDLNFKNISTYISEEGREAIRKQGAWVKDEEDEQVTPLNNGKECAYTVFENNIARCGIEIAFKAGAIDFQKPLSCHLYPIRVSKLGEYTALNYHNWHICDPARELGMKHGLPVFRFLKEAITRAWGEDFYNELEKISGQLAVSSEQ